MNGSLAILLPPGSRCQNCFTQLCGEVAITRKNFLPSLIPDVGNDGALMASCPVSKNPSCVANCLSKNVVCQMQSDEDLWKKVLQEIHLFEIESRECDFCLKSSLSSHRCSSCLTVQYCSTVCQNKDLDFHKTVCSTWAKDKSRRIIDREKQRNYWKSVIEEQWRTADWSLFHNGIFFVKEASSRYHPVFLCKYNWNKYC